MVWGNLIKAGVALGASAIASDKISDAMSDAVEKSAKALVKAANAANAGGGIDAGGSESSAPKKVVAAPKPNVTVKCIGCHAPLSGKQGKTYRCPYCDTAQTLS